MKYCSNCGKQIKFDAKFCENCGCVQEHPQESDSILPGEAQGNQLHCPKCKSTNIHLITERTSTEGGTITVPVFKGIRAGGLNAKTDAEYGWVCQSCGMQFPNISTLEKRISYYRGIRKSALVLCAIFCVATMFYLAIRIAAMCWVTVPCAVALLFVWLYAKHTQEKIVMEKWNMEQRCFH